MFVVNASCLAAALTLLLAGASYAGARVNVDELSADGLTVIDLACELDADGGFLAGLAIVGALAKQKAALDACGPTGAAVRASFRWAGAKTDEVALIAASDADTGACVTRVLAKVEAALGGRCSATLLTGPVEAAKKAAAGLAAPKEANPYADPKAWDTVTMRPQGWQLWVLGGTRMRDATLELDGQTWTGAGGQHAHQLLWVFWHPTAPLDAAVVAKLTAEAYRFAPELKWLPVQTIPADDDFPHVVIEKALRPPHRLYRVVANGRGGRHFILSLFAETMPDEAVLTWLKSITFLTP